jgi:hypothetical protein
MFKRTLQATRLAAVAGVIPIAVSMPTLRNIGASAEYSIVISGLRIFHGMTSDFFRQIRKNISVTNRCGVDA